MKSWLFSEFRPRKNEQGASADREERPHLKSAFNWTLPYKLMKFGLPVRQWCSCSVATDHALVEHKRPLAALCSETVDTCTFYCAECWSCYGDLWRYCEIHINYLYTLLPLLHKIYAQYIIITTIFLCCNDVFSCRYFITLCVTKPCYYRETTYLSTVQYVLFSLVLIDEGYDIITQKISCKDMWLLMS